MISRATLTGLMLPMAGGVAVVLLATAIEPIAFRIPLQVAAVCAAVSSAWFLSRLSSQMLLDHKESTHVLATLAADRRMPGLDRHSGLFAEWYFLLRAGDELERAKRFEEPLALVSISGSAEVIERARQLVWHGLRHIDIAGDLSDSLAVLLPHTDRAGAAIYATRLREEIPDADVHVLAHPEDGPALTAALRADELHFRPPQEAA